MDVWTLGEKFKEQAKEITELIKRVTHIEEYLKKINTKLMLINKVSNEAVQNKQDKSSSVRTKRSTAKKS
jgi:uncharacterized coiled-coil protein SlyX